MGVLWVELLVTSKPLCMLHVLEDERNYLATFKEHRLRDYYVYLYIPGHYL